MLHIKDGLYFERLPHGDLHIVKKDDAGNVTFETVVGRSCVASVMATACARGYTRETFFEAYTYLQTQGHQPKVS